VVLEGHGVLINLNAAEARQLLVSAGVE